MSGATKDYAFKEKNHWRRWLWNRIVQSLQKVGRPPSEAIVLGLFGHRALDVPVALSKGFRVHNLIAVDRDQRAVDSIRASGLTAIGEDLDRVTFNWDNRCRADAVVFDFCGGLDAAASRALGYLGGAKDSGFENAVIAVNLLRGRDAHWNQWREDFTKRPSPSRLGQELFFRQSWAARVDQTMHRGFQLYDSIVLGAADDIDRERFPSARGYLEALDGRFAEACPSFRSYRSGGLVYDSAVFTLTPRLCASIPMLAFDLRPPEDGPGRTRWFARMDRARRKVAAARAVRTMRAKAAAESA